MMNQQRSNKIRNRLVHLQAEKICKECTTRSHPNYHKFVNETMKQLESPEATRKKLLSIVQTLSISSDGLKQTQYIEGFKKFHKLDPAS